MFTLLLIPSHVEHRNKHAARRAHTILSTMEKLHARKKSSVQPDLDCYRNVLIAMSRSRVPSVGASIPNIFKSMEDNHIFPDTACFDAAIETLKNCARRSKGPDDAVMYAKAAENMLKKMEKESDRSSVSVVKPSSVSYTNVIKALASRGSAKAAERADEFLMKMVAEYDRGNESMKPTRESYKGTMHAYRSCGSANSFVKANEVLQRMITDHSKGNDAASPDVSCFHTVISACNRAAMTSSSPEKHREALMLAISTIQLMKKSGANHPNTTTYLLLLQCCSSLLPLGTEREGALRSIFRSCCKDGMVSGKVLSEFQSAVSTDTYHKEVVRDAPSYNGIKSLPDNWTRGLGFTKRKHEAHGGGIRKRSSTRTFSLSGEMIASAASKQHNMKRRLSKTNQRYLQGGRPKSSRMNSMM